MSGTLNFNSDELAQLKRLTELDAKRLTSPLPNSEDLELGA